MIVPFYNVEAYLADCLDSILGQTFGDFEVLLVDDGSPDGSRAIAERYADRDAWLRIVTQENGGLGAAHNTGVREARGRYGPSSTPTTCSHPVAGAAARQRPAAGSDVVVGSVERFDGRTGWLPTGWRTYVVRREQVRIEEFLPLLRNLYTWNKLFRRDFWDAQGLWFREGSPTRTSRSSPRLFARAFDRRAARSSTLPRA